MGATPAVLQPGVQLGNVAASIYDQIAAAQAVVARAVFANVSGGTVTITVYRVPSGGSFGVANTIVPLQSIAANGTFISPEIANMVLNQGDSLWAKASAGGAVNAFLHGYTT